MRNAWASGGEEQEVTQITKNFVVNQAATPNQPVEVADSAIGEATNLIDHLLHADNQWVAVAIILLIGYGLYLWKGKK